LALDDARLKKQCAYRRGKISGETQDLGSLCFDIFEPYNDLQNEPSQLPEEKQHGMQA